MLDKIRLDYNITSVLKGRHPLDLPNIDTIKDILIEVEDTGKFEIQYYHQRGRTYPITYCESVYESLVLEPQPFSSTIRVVNKNVLISEVKLNINIKWLGIDCDINEPMNVLRDVIGRLEDYLGKDEIEINWNSYMGLVSLEAISYQIT